MIGQEKILEQIDNLINSNRFPKFMIIQGARGWGKKELTREIAKKLNIDLVFFENKVDDIRECIKLAYEQTAPILYALLDGDTMSNAAKNSILKLIEEPPLNAYIILLIENEETILPTIKSRAYIIRIDNYKECEIKDYLAKKDNSFTSEEINKIISICNCPGDINLVLQEENKELLDLVDKLIDNIGKVTLSNLLKVTKKFKLNDSTEGIDLNLFLNCCQHRLFQKYLLSKSLEYYRCYVEIISAKKSLRSVSSNKLFILDNLLIRMWKVWNYGN